MRQVFLVASLVSVAFVVISQKTEQKISNEAIQKKIGQWHVDIALADITIQQARDSLKN